MAKAQSKKAATRSRKRPQVRSNDAERLAALRWLVMRIEQVSIEVFVTNRRNFGAVEAALRLQVKMLRQIGQPDSALVADDCPAGFILCRDGFCSPMCDEGIPPAPPAPANVQRGRKY